MAEKKAKDYRAGKTTMEVSKDLADMIRFIADRHDITIPEALDRYALPAVTREFKRVQDQMTAVLGGEG